MVEGFMIEYRIQTLFDDVWTTVYTILKPIEMCPPQRILTAILTDWLDSSGETEGEWVMGAYDHETGNRISVSATITAGR
jgi:hypothetical protein